MVSTELTDEEAAAQVAVTLWSHGDGARAKCKRKLAKWLIEQHGNESEKNGAQFGALPWRYEFRASKLLKNALEKLNDTGRV